MDTPRSRLSSIRKAGTVPPRPAVPQRPVPPRPPAPQRRTAVQPSAPQRSIPSPLAASVVVEEEEYVSPLAAPPAKPLVPRSALSIPEMKVKPKTNAPKKRGRPAGVKNSKRRGDSGLILTDRDQQKLSALMNHGWMTRYHLAFLCGEVPSLAEKRVRELIKAGYIDAHRVDGRKYLYLTAKGFKAVEAQMPFYSSRRNVRPSAHDLKVITVCAALGLGDDAFYSLSHREVEILNQNKKAHNLRVQKRNTVLRAQQQTILAKGARSEDEQAVLDAKPESYRTEVFDYQTPQEFAPGVITGPKHVITEAQINEANKRANRRLLEQFREANGYELNDKNPCREEWGQKVEGIFMKSYPVREEGDVSPLSDDEANHISQTLGDPRRAWLFDHLNKSHISRNPHLGARGTFNKTHRPDGVIVLPHVRGRDGYVRGGCVAIEVEEHMKNPKQTVENMVALFDHPLYDRAIYYVPDGVGENNIRNRFDAVESELKHGYIVDEPLREAIERFFIIVRMDEDYYLSYRSSPKGEWG